MTRERPVHLSNDEIRAIIRELKGMPSAKRSAWCMANRAEFALQFPTLLRACVNDAFDMSFLDMMLEHRTMIENKDTSVAEADKAVYDSLRAVYVDPLVERATRQRQQSDT